MKIRQGFVSNSSSSSFIVVFDQKPQSTKELQKILYGDQKTIVSYNDDTRFRTDQLSKIVFDDITNPENISSIDKLIEEFTNFYRCNKWDNYKL